MNKKTVLSGLMGIGLIIAVSVLSGPRANALITSVDLGTAGAFAVLAGTPNISNTGPTVVTGDLGIDPAAAVIGFTGPPDGTVVGTIHADDAVAELAKTDLVDAYDDAAGRTPFTVVAGGLLGAQTLVGGVYNAGGVTFDLTGTLTLDGENDPNTVWIFQATSDLITASSSSVVFIRGGQPCNVFWQVTSSATLGSDSDFVGTIIALTSITVNDGVTVDGRLLARNGTVTMINDTITRSTCAAPVPTPVLQTYVPPTPTPTPTPVPIPVEQPLPTAAPLPTATPTATPVPIGNIPAAAPNLPSTSTGDLSSPLVLLTLLVAGVGVFMLRSPIRRR